MYDKTTRGTKGVRRSLRESERETRQRELEAAGWERTERQGKVIWRNPKSGYLYPEDVAAAMIREEADPGEVPKEPEGEA